MQRHLSHVGEKMNRWDVVLVLVLIGIVLIIFSLGRAIGFVNGYDDGYFEGSVDGAFEFNLWEKGKQNLIFSMDQRLKLKVLNEDYYFQEEGNFVYLDSLSCSPHDCSRLTPYYKDYPKAVCLVCDYNVSSQRQEKK